MLGWSCATDDAGNIASLWLEYTKIHDEDEWFDVIAPFVKPGSYIDMVGDDDESWRWFFDGEHCVYRHGITVYPDTDGPIYPHEWAASLVDAIEDIFEKYGAHVPNPEDDKRDYDGNAILCGFVYSEMVDVIEDSFVKLLEESGTPRRVVPGVFS